MCQCYKIPLTVGLMGFYLVYFIGSVKVIDLTVNESHKCLSDSLKIGLYNEACKVFMHGSQNLIK